MKYDYELFERYKFNEELGFVSTKVLVDPVEGSHEINGEKLEMYLNETNFWEFILAWFRDKYKLTDVEYRQRLKYLYALTDKDDNQSVVWQDVSRLFPMLFKGDDISDLKIESKLFCVLIPRLDPVVEIQMMRTMIDEKPSELMQAATNAGWGDLFELDDASGFGFSIGDYVINGSNNVYQLSELWTHRHAGRTIRKGTILEIWLSELINLGDWVVSKNDKTLTRNGMVQILMALDENITVNTPITNI